MCCWTRATSGTSINDLPKNASNVAPVLVILFSLTPHNTHIVVFIRFLALVLRRVCRDDSCHQSYYYHHYHVHHYFDHVSREFLILAMLLNNKPPLRSGPSALAPRVVRHQRRVSTARLPCVAVAWGAQRWCFGRLQRKLSTVTKQRN